MGTKGPFTVIQNEGANIYSFNMFDLEHFREKGNYKGVAKGKEGEGPLFFCFVFVFVTLNKTRR